MKQEVFFPLTNQPTHPQTPLLNCEYPHGALCGQKVNLMMLLMSQMKMGTFYVILWTRIAYRYPHVHCRFL